VKGIRFFHTLKYVVYLRHSLLDLSSVLIVSNQVGSFPQALDDELVALGPAVDVLDIVSGGLKVTGGVVALGDEDVVIDAALQRLVEGNRSALLWSATQFQSHTFYLP
jgi:hypothetical protein